MVFEDIEEHEIEKRKEIFYVKAYLGRYILCFLDTLQKREINGYNSVDGFVQINIISFFAAAILNYCVILINSGNEQKKR